MPGNLQMTQRELKMLINNPEPDSVEIVIGLVAPIGTDLESFVPNLQMELVSVGYESHAIRMSQILDDTIVAQPNTLPDQSSPEYYQERMSAGDNLREAFKSGDALAAYAIAKIRQNRDSTTEGRRNQERAVASIIRTIKHPEEVELFRLVYGSRFILIGVSSPESERIDHLTELLCKQQSTFDRPEMRSLATQLISRDEQDAENLEYGQRVRETFSNANAFVEISRGHSSEKEIKRLVGLLFGRPFIAPTRQEQSMFTAWSAAFRSTAFGRQVGAALTNPAGDLIATGTNEVPAPGGGEYWEGDTPDHRDFRHQADFNQQTTLQVIANMFDGLNKAGWLKDEWSQKGAGELARTALDKSSTPAGPLSGRRVRDIIEFGRIAHAEMSAISSAARRGIPTQGATLYTTTYPCHMCGRMIINAGIERVIYVDPYPKSMVPSMYGDMISETLSDKDSHVIFQRFVGIAPSLFPTVFSEINRSRDKNGRTNHIPTEKLRFRPAQGATMTSANILEAAVVLELGLQIKKIDSVEA